MTNTRYAHRGYHQKPLVPENSLPAFAQAIERGWGAELDVHLTKDGKLVVFHDSELFRCTGEKGILEERTFGELMQLRLEGTDNKIPSFDQVLSMFEGVQPLIIELKAYGGNHKELAQKVCERLGSYKGDYCIESFDPRAILAVKKLRPGTCIGQLSQNFFRGEEAAVAKWQRRVLTNMWFNAITKPDFVAYKFEDRENKANRRAIKRGCQEVCWTIRSKKDMLAVEAGGGIAIFEGFDPDAEEAK